MQVPNKLPEHKRMPTMEMISYRKASCPQYQHGTEDMSFSIERLAEVLSRTWC